MFCATNKINHQDNLILDSKIVTNFFILFYLHFMPGRGSVSQCSPFNELQILRHYLLRLHLSQVSQKQVRLFVALQFAKTSQ